MKPEIVLHVGAEKTGSTSIQNLLSSSYDKLIQSSILFPSTIGQPCHINLTTCALKGDPGHPLRKLLDLQRDNDFDDFVLKTKKNLRDEIDRVNPKVIIISDEHINVHLSKKESLLAFKEICEEFGEIKSVVIYLRQQDEFRLSLFSEAVKSGNLSNFDLDDPLPIFEKIPYRLNYLSILDNLSNVFGRNLIVPKIYNRNLFPSRDICEDFLNTTDINLEHEVSKKSERNRSVDGKIIKHLASISASLKGLNKDWSEKLRAIVIYNCENIFSGPGAILEKKRHAHFLEQFTEMNRTIKEKYFHISQVGNELFPNSYIENNSGKPVYPDCTISWAEFFIKYIVSVSKMNSTICEVGETKEENILANDVENAVCGVCGASYLIDVSVHSREGRLCPKCGASGRAQAIAYYISSILLNKVIPLKNHQIDKTKKVVGLSDGRVYASILGKKYDYTNTFYHQEPFLDITNPSNELHGVFDLLITTEVFEHIIGPSIAAFHGAFDILKPGGYMILTIPFINKGESVEHYHDDLVNYTSYQEKDGRWVAELEFSDGHKEIDESAKFHGGPGKTLEIRLFNRDRLINELNIAGFVNIEIHDKNLPQYGINWGPASRVITAKKTIN